MRRANSIAVMIDVICSGLRLFTFGSRLYQLLVIVCDHFIAAITMQVWRLFVQR